MQSADRWVQYLLQYVPEIEYSLNTRVSSVTKHSLWEDQFIQTRRRGKRRENVRILRNRINILQQIAHENQMEAAERQHSFHDAHAEAHSFNVGDTVWYYKDSSTEKGVTSKLAFR